MFQSLGNHEFDNGVSGLTPFIENLTSPVLAANLILTKVPELEREKNLKKSVIIDISGHKIGIIGYLTPETKILAVENDVDYIDEVVALKSEVAALQSQGVKIIIALGHSGYVKDLQIAKEVNGINLVIGGHSNTFLWNGTSPDAEEIQGNYPTYVKQASGKLVPVVQAYAYTKYLGKLHMVFNSNGDLIKADGQPILLNSSIPQDPQVLRIVERYREGVLNVTQAVVGSTAVALDGLNCQYLECNLGNLITDAIIFSYAENYTGEHWTDAPIAIIQGGGIRSSIAHPEKPAAITEEDLMSVLPFKGSITKVTMNGSTLFKMMEHSVADYNFLDYPGEFLQFSGIHVVYDLKKPPQSRVVEAKARCSACKIPEYTKVGKSHLYNVLMPTFLANGGDGYSMFKGLPMNTYNYDELFCTRRYVQKHSPVLHGIEDRITLLNPQALKGSSSVVSPSLHLMTSLLIAFTLKRL